MAIAAVTNFGLVLFDLTYVSWRDFWLRGMVQVPIVNAVIKVPGLAQLDVPRLYDPIKGIEPHRDTQRYLEAVQQFEQQANQSGLNSPVAQQSLESLRSLSIEMIDTNPFALANKSGTLEKIKNRMRDRIFGSRANRASSRQAVTTFWSSTYLTDANWRQEVQWFNQTITPLIQTNYFRTISETGDFTNNFGVIDTPFALLFLLEFLARTFYLSRRYSSLSWVDAMLWRWYDVLLFMPFWLLFPSFALLRVIPVVLRLHQARFIQLGRVRDRTVELVVGSVAEELAEVVVIQVIDQVQVALRQGDITRWLAQTITQPRVDINNTDEVAAISTLLLKLTVYQVLPQLQPDLTALLSHNVDSILKQAPAYQALKNLPGVTHLSVQLTDRLVTEVIQQVQSAFTAALNDTTGAEISGRLVRNFGQTLGTELQDQRALQEIQSLLTDLLEEVKLGFMQRSTETSAEALLEETRQLRQAAKDRT